MPAPAPRVIVVDDSAVVRGILTRGLQAHGLDVVASASNPFSARDLILRLRPDVITLDIEMPRMNGLTFLERLMAFQPMPVVVLSSLTPEGGATALRAMELGAVEVLAKPSHNMAEGDGSRDMARLAAVVRASAQARVRRRWSAGIKMKLASGKREGGYASRVLALGASTGGTQALPMLLASHPPEGVGCVMVQHMPGGFTEGFAARLNELSPWRVREARHGEWLREGDALLAPGDRHMALKRVDQAWAVELLDGPPVHFVRPSVDILFESVAREAGPAAAGALLTGMGRDGAAGLLSMRRAGAATFCQDQESSVVFGMPKEAWEAGAAERMLPLEELAPALYRALGRILLPGKAA